MSYPRLNEHALKRTWGGVDWSSWSIGVSRTERRSPDGRCAVRRTYNHSGYNALLDGHMIMTGRRPKTFRSEEAAALAALKWAKETKP
jgi:hypothetical protein